MPNVLTQNPILIDTDITTFRSATSVVATNCTQGCGIRVTKLVLSVGPSGVSSAGTVAITAPSDSAVLYPPLIVTAGIAANTELYIDSEPAVTSSVFWRDFAVTGLTATGTRLFLWYKV